MAGLWPFGRGRRGRTAVGEAPRRASHPAALKREHRALLREREERIRDLGGLVFEMFRRDRFRVELVTERCADLVALEERLSELDAFLSRRGSLRCACGAPLAWGAHFCANCGRPAGSPVVSCARCGAPLPADVKFCSSCGSSVGHRPAPPADTQPEPAAKEPAEV
jgi:predicted amidophosphoribosyltransferase